MNATHTLFALIFVVVTAAACGTQASSPSLSPADRSADAGNAAQAAAKHADEPMDKSDGASKAPATVQNGSCVQRTIPKCAAGMKTQPFTVGLNKRNPIKSGTQVHLMGPLVAQVGCTEMGCPPGVACNDCSGNITLGPKWSFTAPDPSEYTKLVLFDDQGSKNFSCNGNERDVCCAYEAKGQQVVVSGEFGVFNGEYGIKNPTICAP